MEDNRDVIDKLSNAVLAGDVETVSRIIHEKNNPNLLHVAVGMRREPVVEVLLRENADVNKKNSEGKTALHIAAEEGFLELIFLLLSKGADVNARTEDGETALSLAIRKCHTAVVKGLLENGALVTGTDSYNDPLYSAISKGSVEIIKALVKHGADVNARKGFYTPLMEASRNETVDVVEVLLSLGANTDCWDGKGRTALYLTLDYNEFENFEAILRYAPDLHSKRCRNVLYGAARKGDERHVAALLNYGADINLQGSALFIALGGHHHPIHDDGIKRPKMNELRILQLHLLKMLTANLFVNEINLKLMDEATLVLGQTFQEEVRSLENEWKKELDDMKKDTINNSKISFHDVLTLKPRELVKILTLDVVQVLQADDLPSKFPHYAGLQRCNFRRSLLERGNLMKPACEVCNYVFQRELPPECAEEIFKYLRYWDLKSFIQAAELNPEFPKSDRKENVEGTRQVKNNYGEFWVRASRLFRNCRSWFRKA